MTAKSAPVAPTSSSSSMLPPAAFLPFDFVRLPDFKLRLPSSLPSWFTVFCISYLVYYLITAGIIYDRIVEPPAIGSEQDPVTGAVKPVAFVQYRVNGQFIIEGLSSAFMFSLGGVGLILLNVALRTSSKVNRMLYLVGGGALVLFAFFMLRIFIRIKIPNYLVGME